MIHSHLEDVPPKPSDVWLENPGWIDGALPTPVAYIDKHAMVRALRHWDPTSHHIDQLEADLLRESDFHDRLAAINSSGPPPFHTPHVPHPSSQATVLHAAIEPEFPTTISLLQYIPQPAKVSKNGRVTQPDAAKKGIGKDLQLVFGDLSRTEVLRRAFDAHQVGLQYEPGPQRGPPMKMWWTGRQKGGATTIETDLEYSNAIASLKSRKGKTQVTIELDVDELYPFRRAILDAPLPSNVVKSTPIPGAAPSNGLLLGTHVPIMDSFSPETQVNGTWILQLRTKWLCQDPTHAGENGAPGHCWRDANGCHIGVSNNGFKVWGAACAARVEGVSLECPPNSPEFDFRRDGSRRDTNSGPRPRGQTGPRSAKREATNDASDPLVSFGKLIGGLISARVAPATPKHRNTDDSPVSTPRKRRRRDSTPEPPSSPIAPPPSEEIQRCVDAFLRKKRIDWTPYIDILMEHSFTPDIMGMVGMVRLQELLPAAPEGEVMRWMKHCDEYTARQRSPKKRRTN
ncbi:hypothetical protein CYLTODRAFT_481537 [Cylindrobasidium torrendii FP15055 ss-10]|uniref:Uncharacterized protein n=1 Tax=Cylindrobasidium torrendii FP15055 ss-10 TaxID=1314674 RepID=A0A0D7BDD6_9AGAR|nr:hypothetical protein CYLTODRAFT_481537 [Cylindrobasidium torrendii FP15055 ss-10]